MQKETIRGGVLNIQKKSRHDDTWTTWKLYEKAEKTAFIPIVLHYWRNDPNSFGRRKFDMTHFDGIDAYKEQLEYFYRKKDSVMWKLHLHRIWRCFFGATTV